MSSRVHNIHFTAGCAAQGGRGLRVCPLSIDLLARPPYGGKQIPFVVPRGHLVISVDQVVQKGTQTGRL